MISGKYGTDLLPAGGPTTVTMLDEQMAGAYRIVLWRRRGCAQELYTG
jgi:hypothetical protein